MAWETFMLDGGVAQNNSGPVVGEGLAMVGNRVSSWRTQGTHKKLGRNSAEV